MIKAWNKLIKPVLSDGCKRGPGRTPCSNSAGCLSLAVGGIFIGAIAVFLVDKGVELLDILQIDNLVGAFFV